MNAKFVIPIVILIAIVIVIIIILMEDSSQSVQLDNFTSIEMNLSSKSSYSISEPIIVNLEISNVGNNAVEVLDIFLLEDYPIRFEITNSANEQILFLGPEMNPKISSDDFTTLYPNDSIPSSFNLIENNVLGFSHYDLNMPDSYEITAIYSPHFGIDETRSNTISFTIHN